MTNRLTELFLHRSDDTKVMNLYLTAGYPTLDATVPLILEMEKNGADIIELGMPYSDPLADGPTIQLASDVAIKNGVTLPLIFEMVKEVRKSSSIPIILMGYINPILHYGLERFVDDAANAGVDGFILPDVPPEESEEIAHLTTPKNISHIHLVAPNTSDERMKHVDSISSGFVYCVSVTGVTGARTQEEVRTSVQKFIQRVKQNVVHNPVLIGFGISSYEDAQEIAQEVEGFIVGSALINTIRVNFPNEDWKEKTMNFVHALKFGS